MGCLLHTPTRDRTRGLLVHRTSSSQLSHTGPGCQGLLSNHFAEAWLTGEKPRRFSGHDPMSVGTRGRQASVCCKGGLPGQPVPPEPHRRQLPGPGGTSCGLGGAEHAGSE